MGCSFQVKVNGILLAQTTQGKNKMEIFETKQGKWPKEQKKGLDFWSPEYKVNSEQGEFLPNFEGPKQCQNLLKDLKKIKKTYKSYIDAFGENSSPIWFESCEGKNKDRRLSFRLVIEKTDILPEISEAPSPIFKVAAKPPAIKITKPIGKVVDDSQDPIYFNFKVFGQANCVEGDYCKCKGKVCTEQVTFTAENFLFCKYV
jgi:hypothetical protein